MDPEEMSDAEIEARIEAIHAYLGQFTDEIKVLDEEVRRRRAQRSRSRLRLLHGGGEIAALVAAAPMALLRHRPRHPLAASGVFIAAGALTALALLPNHTAPQQPMPAALPPTLGLPVISATSPILTATAQTPGSAGATRGTASTGGQGAPTGPEPSSTTTAAPTVTGTAPGTPSPTGNPTTPPPTTGPPTPADSCKVEVIVRGVIKVCVTWR